MVWVKNGVYVGILEMLKCFEVYEVKFIFKG